jgi:hypothetical protein
MTPIMLQNGNGSGNYPEELYDECFRVAGKSFCDFLFKRNSTQAFSNLSSSSSAISTNPPNSTYLTYNDNDLGFSVQYPSSWTIDNENSQYSTVVGFDSPEDGASVDIRIFPKGEYNSIKEYGDKNFKESEDQTLLGYYRNSSTLLSGKPAFRAIYLTTYNPSVFEDAFGYQSSTSKALFTATLVPEKKSIYAIAYFANSFDFNNYLPEIEKMIDSFQIYGKGPIIQEENSSSSSP